MFGCAPDPLPKTVDCRHNIPGAVRAVAHKANIAYANKLDLEDQMRVMKSSGKMNPDHYDELSSKMTEHHNDAVRLHHLALTLEKKNHDEMTTFGRMKPGIMKAIFATAIGAEIISIPVLLMSCVMMTRPHPNHQAATAA
jgi:hypothetical protein